MDYLNDTLNVKMLTNQSCRIPERSLVLAGVTDPAAKKIKAPLPDLSGTLKDVAAHDFVVLLSHQPRLAVPASKYPVDLQLSGHTHGGMIAGFEHLVASFNEGFSSGIYAIGDMLLYVSNGTGIWSGFPIRLGKDSEITLLICSPEKTAKKSKD